MDSQRHPNVHAAWSQWSEEQTLHVVTVYFNPFRYANRLRLHHDFANHMSRTPNVQLHVVEVAFGDRPFEVTGPGDVQLRSKDALWLKENALNIGFSRLPLGWKYAAYIDDDFHFTRHDWALEAIHLLQHNDWAQLFSSYALLNEEYKPTRVMPSFTYAYHNNFGGKLANQVKFMDSGAVGSVPGKSPFNTTPGATGGAWAFTNYGLSATGGLLDTCVLGASDWYMAFGLVGNTVDGHPEALHCGPAYEDSIRRWQSRAYKTIEGNVGYVDCFCTHGWHGAMAKRGYGDRWHILRDFQFNPYEDIVKDCQGLYQWSGEKPKMRDAVNRYFTSRDEDGSGNTEEALI